MYRGDTLFKVRYGEYKAHFYTWGTPLDAQHLVSDSGWHLWHPPGVSRPIQNKKDTPYPFYNFV